MNLPFFREETLSFRGLNWIDFVQINCDEYQVLPQAAYTSKI